MGKWEAEHIQYGQWHVTKDDMVIAYRADATEAQPFNKDQATRYALALNVVDAGVDFGEFAKHLAHYRGNRHHSESPYATSAETTHNFYQALTYFETIANAVEGDTATKGDV